MKSNYKLFIFLFILTALLFSGCNRDNYDETEIFLDEFVIETKGSNKIEHEDNKVIITEGGYYRIKGYGQNVQIYVDCEEMVTLVLDDIQIVNDEISAIKIKSGANVIIESAGKDENTIKMTDEKSKQCIKAEGNLTIIGEIPLVLEGNDGIKGETLILQSAEINIYQIKTAIRADHILITDSIININSLNDKSFGIYAKDTVELVQSDITISTIDDCIHSEETIKIDGGNLILNTYDDAIHARENISLLGGTINIEKCLEGIEGKSIDIYGGEIFIVSDNDGINAVCEDETETAVINIHGGKIRINAYGDGLDSNGDIFIDGGVLFVSGAYDGNNNAIDFDDEFIINGGAVIAAGNNKDAKPPSEESTQDSVMFIYDDTQREGTGFVIVDENGTPYLAADFFKPYDNLIISIPELELEKGYYFGETKAIADGYKYPIIDEQIIFEVKSNNSFYLYDKISLIWR